MRGVIYCFPKGDTNLMVLQSPLRRAAAPSFGAVGALLAVLIVGCGGGSGSSNGGGGGVPFGRSYQFTGGGHTFVMSVDSTGRFTIFVKDANAPAIVNSGQGSLATDGKFFTQSPDSTLQFSGTVASDGNSVSGTVNKNAVALFSFNGTLVTPSATSTTALSGTYFVTGGGNSAYITVDVTGHAALFSVVNTVSGGGLLSVSSTGALTSSDGSNAGQLTQNGATFTLQITKLGGATVSFNSTITKATRAKWTFMVFMNAANNLEAFAAPNVNQMESVGSTGDVNIVVQWKEANCSDCGTPKFAGTRRYLITRDNNANTVNSTLVQDLGTGIDMGKPQELTNFVSWAQSRYPADHYALAMWDHGAGWLQTRTTNRLIPPTKRAVSTDDEFNTEIEIWQLPSSLNVSPKLDMLIFDASLMQMVEVAYELRNTVPIMVGSEESPPGEGYIYNTFLAELVAAPTMTSAQFGTKIVRDTLEPAPGGYGTGNNLTQSCLDLSKIENLANKISALGSSLDAHIGDTRNVMVDARTNAQHYAYNDNKDLWDYGDIIKAGTGAADLKQAVTNVQTAITAALIAEAHGTINGKSHGIAIYVPSPDAYVSNYASIAFGRNTSWARWLQDQPLNKQ